MGRRLVYDLWSLDDDGDAETDMVLYAGELFALVKVDLTGDHTVKVNEDARHRRVTNAVPSD